MTDVLELSPKSITNDELSCEIRFRESFQADRCSVSIYALVALVAEFN